MLVSVSRKHRGSRVRAPMFPNYSTRPSGHVTVLLAYVEERIGCLRLVAYAWLSACRQSAYILTGSFLPYEGQPGLCEVFFEGLLDHVHGFYRSLWKLASRPQCDKRVFILASTRYAGFDRIYLFLIFLSLFSGHCF